MYHFAVEEVNMDADLLKNAVARAYTPFLPVPRQSPEVEHFQTIPPNTQTLSSCGRFSH